MKLTWDLKYQTLIPLSLISIIALLYLFTLDTGLRPDELTGGDLITHQYAQVQGRFSNAPGYPLYTMLGWVWFRLGRALLSWLLNPIQILSLYSTIWGLASLWVLYHLLLRPDVSEQNWVISTILTGFYATTYFFWYYTVTTEQYTSAILQTLLLVYLVFEWENAATNQIVWLMALVSGTMAANMLTTLFILPPLLYLIFSKRPAILTNIPLLIQTTVIGLLPLLSYSYVFIRGAQHPEWRGTGSWATTSEWFTQFISTQQGRDELAPGLTWQNLITAEFPALIWQELTWGVLLGGLVGLTLMGRRLTIFFYSSLAIYACFVTAYRFGNWFQVILPAYPLLVLGFGRAVAVLWRRLQPVRWAQAGLVVLLLLLVSYRATTSFPRANQRYLPTDTGLDPGWAILKNVTESGWTISATFAEWVALQYLDVVWGATPTIQLVPPGEPAHYVTRQAATITPHLIDLSTTYPQAIGAELINLSPHLVEMPSPSPDLVLLPHQFTDQMSLIGYQIKDSGHLVKLFWTPQTTMTIDYTISVRLWQFGHPIQTDTGPLQQDHQPVWGVYPTSQWPLGGIISDAYTFKLPPDTQPTQLHLVVYHQTEAGFENLGDLLIDIE